MSTKKDTSTHNSLNYALKIDDEDIDKEMMKPFTYFTSIPGKEVRTNLLNVFTHWVTISQDDLKKLDSIMYIAHNTILLLDDIQDDSLLRRGVPVVHKIYGIPKTIIAVNWVMSIVANFFEELDNMELTKKIMKKAIEICAGQGMELYWRDNHICPTEAEYLQMICRKTSLLFIAAQMAINYFSIGKQVNADKFLMAFGVYFQINDDYQNLHNQIYFDSKGFCEDITEGKFSYPIVHAVNNFPKEGKEIIEILRQRTYDVETKKRCLSILEECGSFEYTRKKIEELKSVTNAEAAKLGENPFIGAFLEKTMLAFL